jgi:hypothetical protein
VLASNCQQLAAVSQIGLGELLLGLGFADLLPPAAQVAAAAAAVQHVEHLVDAAGDGQHPAAEEIKMLIARG